MFSRSRFNKCETVIKNVSFWAVSLFELNNNKGINFQYRTILFCLSFKDKSEYMQVCVVILRKIWGKNKSEACRKAEFVNEKGRYGDSYLK